MIKCSQNSRKGSWDGFADKQNKDGEWMQWKCSQKAQQNTVVGKTARMTQDIQTSCHQEDISSDFQS